MKDLSSPNSKEEQKLYELCVSVSFGSVTTEGFHELTIEIIQLVSKEKDVEVLFRALVSLGTLVRIVTWHFNFTFF